MTGPRRSLRKTEGVCPWWLAYTFDNPLRRVVHDPEEILRSYVKPGDTVADIGCGMGFFSLGMARLVGGGGRVIAVDLQYRMLRSVLRRARRAGLAARVRLHRCEPERLRIPGPVDFALAFWMVHEVPDKGRFFREILGALRPGGRFLMAEPRMHVGLADFAATVEKASAAGFEPLPEVRIRWSRSMLFSRRPLPRPCGMRKTPWT